MQTPMLPSSRALRSRPDLGGGPGASGRAITIPFLTRKCEFWKPPAAPWCQPCGECFRKHLGRGSRVGEVQKGALGSRSSGHHCVHYAKRTAGVS